MIKYYKVKVNKMKVLSIFYIFFLIVFIGGCKTSYQSKNVVSKSKEFIIPEEINEYKLKVGDTIVIKFFYNPELNEEVIIRPDGKISLQLIDDVVAAGLSPSELDRLLTEKYSKVLKYPEVTVIIKNFAPQVVYVGGEVKAPGFITIPISGQLTTLQAIIKVGGFKNTAELKNVVILRKGKNNKPIFITVNLKDTLKNSQNYSDIFLKPYDIVYVPRTTIAKFNQFVEQYIDKLIPISRTIGFSWVYYLNPPVHIK